MEAHSQRKLQVGAVDWERQCRIRGVFYLEVPATTLSTKILCSLKSTLLTPGEINVCTLSIEKISLVDKKQTCYCEIVGMSL